VDGCALHALQSRGVKIHAWKAQAKEHRVEASVAKEVQAAAFVASLFDGEGNTSRALRDSNLSLRQEIAMSSAEMKHMQANASFSPKDAATTASTVPATVNTSLASKGSNRSIVEDTIASSTEFQHKQVPSHQAVQPRIVQHNATAGMATVAATVVQGPSESVAVPHAALSDQSLHRKAQEPVHGSSYMGQPSSAGKTQARVTRSSLFSRLLAMSQASAPPLAGSFDAARWQGIFTCLCVMVLVMIALHACV